MTAIWNKRDWMWKLPDERIWSTKEASFVNGSVAEAWLAQKPGLAQIPPSPVDKNGERTLDGLAQNLAAYGLPLGELATSEELFASLRAERDKRISATDYLLMTDYPISADALAEVEAYRTALRDLPAKEGAPWDGGGEKTPWPEMPEI